MNKRWLNKSIPQKESVDALSKAINVNEYLCAILLQRGISSYEEARKFFRPSLTDLHDPFLMKDMEKAVNRIKLAIDRGEKILIYGDYDVDGTTAVSVVYSYLSSLYSNCDFYIPDRSSEGYGVSQKGILWAAENKFSLIIALDLGIKASDMVVLANHKGIDFIICDHHLPDKKIPLAIAVLDPKQEDCHYPFTELSGCGIGFKLLQAYAQKFGDEKNIFEYLDLVAVSIASDIVPICGENRILAHHGLIKLNNNPRPGLKALKDIALVKSELDISGVVFTLGPRINAAGRVAHASGAVELLNAKTVEEANAFAEKVNIKNELRREFDLSITEEALAMIGADETLAKAKSTVLFKDSWHKGVIGIVAARCIERYYRPTVILTESNDKITGSARSVNGFDLYQAIEQCSDLLEKFGGHKYAAGLTLDPANLPAFQRRFEEVVASTITDEMLTPVVEIDLSIRFDVITPKFISILKQMAPFGPENQKPVFEAQHVFVMNSLNTFKDRHLRFLAGQRGCNNFFNAVGFDQMEHYESLQAGDDFRIAFTIEENYFNGNTTVQLRIKDIKFY
ncbi:MAG TPA: single-stranded-DNA-specific exonuclease RecJ [Cyclobacteriaceae bacterium]|nr:single-stranded-DNA-specific exonuclease RecJ [Cyclobacteriaceae bacterium]